MNNLIKTFKNIWAIEDLRFRILNTLGFLLIFRLGSYIVLPGVDATSPELASKDLSGLLGLLDTFSGGAFSKASIFALGIMPYISASIVLQLLTVAVPYFQKLQNEGESGRRKINQYTRVLTIFITIGQGIGYLAAYVPQSSIYAGIDQYFFDFTSVIVLTAGTMFCMWLGERITDKGIGNGISMLIMVGIVSRLPAALIQEASTRGMNGAFIFIIELIGLFFVVMGVVMLTQATRRIPVQYAKQVVGNKVYGGQREYIPLKLNSSGVMPIIFAQSLMFVPSLVGSMWAESSDFAAYVSTTFGDITSWQYSLAFCLLIIVFTYFYTAIAVDPNRISNDLKRNNGFIPGVKPGQATADYIDAVISRITLPGAIYLCLVAILPAIASTFGITKEFSLFYGGTSLLIMVGVVLDTLQQIDSYLLLKHYEGMMKGGRVKGRTEDVAFA
jgi:preprotein translocase subunit SecY